MNSLVSAIPNWFLFFVFVFFLTLQVFRLKGKQYKISFSFAQKHFTTIFLSSLCKIYFKISFNKLLAFGLNYVCNKSQVQYADFSLLKTRINVWKKDKLYFIPLFVRFILGFRPALYLLIYSTSLYFCCLRPPLELLF